MAVMRVEVTPVAAGAGLEEMNTGGSVSRAPPSGRPMLAHAGASSAPAAAKSAVRCRQECFMGAKLAKIGERTYLWSENVAVNCCEISWNYCIFATNKSKKICLLSRNAGS